MEILQLPNELLNRISEYSTVNDAKSMAIACKRLRNIVTPKIWHRPRLKRESISLETLNEMSHLPIKELHSCFLTFNWWEKWTAIVEYCPLLEEFHVDDERRKLKIRHLKGVLRNSNVAVVFHTKSLLPVQVMMVNQLRDALSSINLKGLMINHFGDGSGHHNFDERFAWTLSELQDFQTFPLGEISARSFWFDEEEGENFQQLFELLCKKKHCAFSMDRYSADEYGDVGYKYRPGDMELLALHEITVPILATSCLSTSCVRHEDKLSVFVPAIKKLKGLQEVIIDEYDPIGDPSIKLFSELPVKCLSTENFVLKDGKVAEAVKVLDRMKYLERLKIQGGYQFHELTFEEFKQFCHLPVKCVNLDSINAIDLNNRLLEFRELMQEMAIEKIHSKYGINNMQVHRHGENGRFKCI